MRSHARVGFKLMYHIVISCRHER